MNWRCAIYKMVGHNRRSCKGKNAGGNEEPEVDANVEESGGVNEGAEPQLYNIHVDADRSEVNVGADMSQVSVDANMSGVSVNANSSNLHVDSQMSNVTADANMSHVEVQCTQASSATSEQYQTPKEKLPVKKARCSVCLKFGHTIKTCPTKCAQTRREMKKNEFSFQTKASQETSGAPKRPPTLPAGSGMYIRGPKPGTRSVSLKTLQEASSRTTNHDSSSSHL